MCVDHTKFGKLLEDNAYLTGFDQFPKSVSDFTIESPTGAMLQVIMNIIVPTNDGLAFAQDSGGSSRDSQNKKPVETKNIQCYTCKEMDHNSYECPNPKHQQQIQRQN